MFAIRNRNNPDEWIIFQPGGRLNHWGPWFERAEFPSEEQANSRVRQGGLEAYADVVNISEPEGNDLSVPGGSV